MAICCTPDTGTPLAVVWIVVIVLVAVIGALLQSPPETYYHYVSNDSSKLQYITIGGESKTNITSNG